MEADTPQLIRKPFFKRDPWTSILAVVGIFLASQFAAVFIVGIYPALKNWDEDRYVEWLTNATTAQFATIALVAAFASYGVLYLVKRAKVTMARVGLVRPAFRDIPYALGAYVAYFVTYLIALAVASRLLPSLNMSQEQQIGFEEVRSNIDYLLAFASLVILPPLWEEIVFRGFLFSSLRAKFRLRYAVIATSLIFGVVHLQFGSEAPLLWVAAIDTFILSCFLCVLRERSGSIWPAVLLHGIKNLVAFTLLFIV